jgi:outer membrane lipoprotein carrier protein
MARRPAAARLARARVAGACLCAGLCFATPLGAEEGGAQTTEQSDAARVARLRNRVEAQRVAAAIQRFYKKTKRYRARFEHTLFLAKQDEKKVRRGRLAFERPRKLSIRYDEPKGHRVVSDGKRVRVYDPDAKTLYISKLKRSLYPAIVAFLEGKAVLPRDYRLRVLDLDRSRVEEGRVLEAVPREPTPVMTRMILYVSDRTGEVRRVLVVDAQGNHNRFDFHQVVTGRDIPNREFRLRPPRGTKTVEP